MRRSLFAILILLILSFVSVRASAIDVEKVFHAANKAYTGGKYEDAEKGYRELIANGIDGASIHNNLGEALYRQGKIGEAIYNFMVAVSLAPRDANINYNLDYARARITDRIERAKRHILMRPFYFMAEKQSRVDAWKMIVIMSVLFWGFAITFLFLRRDWIKWTSIILGMIFLIQIGVVVKKQFFEKPFGVVTSDVAPVYSAPGEGNVLLFNLHEGSDFSILGEDDRGWLQIELPDGKKGWIENGNVVVDDNAKV